MGQPTSTSAACAPPYITPPGEGPARWFEREVHPHEPMLRAYLHGAYPDLQDVEDVMQESYLRVWKANAVQPVRSAKAFMFQVARNLALDILRRIQHSPITAVSDLAVLHVLDAKPVADEIASHREEVELLARAIHSLPPRCREIIVLRKLKCIPQKAIAAQLGISEKTVQVQVVRGVKRIGEILRATGVRCPQENEAGALRTSHA